MSISSSSHLAPDDVARHTFGSVRRGFDPDEVRAYLESLAASLRGVAERERQLLEELADAEHRAAHPVLDEATLTAALGTETARVLHSAHEVAAEMVAKAEAEAEPAADRGPGGDPAEPDPDRGPAGRADGGHRGGGQRAPRAHRPAGRRHAWSRPDARPTSWWTGPASSAGPWWRRPRDCGPGCWPTCPSDGRCSTPRSSSSGPDVSGWPRRSRMSAGRSTPSPTTCSPPRTTPDWRPRRPAARRWIGPNGHARGAGRATAGRRAGGRRLRGRLDRHPARCPGRPDEAGTGTTPVGATVGMALGEVPGGPPGEGPAAEVAPPEEVDACRQAPGGPPDADDPEPDSTPEPVPSPNRRWRRPPRPPRAADPEPAGPEPRAAPRGPASRVPPPPEPPPRGRRPSGPLPRPRHAQGRATAVSAASPDAAPTAVPATAGAEDGPGNGGTGAPLGAATDDGDDGDDDGPPEERSPLAIRRDELIDPIVTALARRLKRTLQDSQNELLDSLRSNGSRWSIDLLPDETEHVDAVSTAAVPGPGAGGRGRGVLRRAEAEPPARTPMCWWGSPTIWPRRWSDRCAAGWPTGTAWTGAEESVVAEHVGSAFREWKGERIERLAGDHVVAAFSAGIDRRRRGGRRLRAGVGGRRRARGTPPAPTVRTTD